MYGFGTSGGVGRISRSGFWVWRRWTFFFFGGHGGVVFCDAHVSMEGRIARRRCLERIDGDSD